MGQFAMIFICVWFVSTMAYAIIKTIKETANGNTKKEILYSVIFFAIVSFFCFSYMSEQNKKDMIIGNHLYEIEKTVNEIAQEIDDSYIGIHDKLGDIYQNVQEIYPLIDI